MEQMAVDRMGSCDVVFGVYRDGDNNLDAVHGRDFARAIGAYNSFEDAAGAAAA